MRRLYCTVLVACSLLVSCGDDEGFTFSPVPSANLTVINAIPESPELTVIVNNLSQGNIAFGEATPNNTVLPQIPLDYRISFFNDAVDQEVVASNVTLDIGFSQTIVLTGTIDNPTTTNIIEAPFEYPEGSTDTRIRFLNATSSVASATVSLINPNGTNENIVITRGQPTSFTTTTAGAGVQIEVRDTSTNALLWESGSFALTAAGDRQLVLLDYFGPGGQTVRMTSINDPAGTALFLDEQLPAAIRFTNQTANRGDLDFYVDDTLVATLPFNGVSDYINAEPGLRNVRITPAGDNTTELANTDRTLFIGFFHTIQVASNVDGTAVGTGFLAEQRRPVSTQAIINITKLAPVITAVDLRFQLPGEGLVGNPDLNQIADFASGTINIVPRDYDLFVTEAGTTNVLIGPQTLTLNARGYYTLQITESAGGGTPLQLQLLDDFQ